MASSTTSPRARWAQTRSRAQARVRLTAEVAGTRMTRVKHVLGIPGALAIGAVVFGQLLVTEVTLVLDSRLEMLLGLLTVAAVLLGLAYRYSGQLAGDVGEAAYGSPGTHKLPRRRGLVLLVGLDSAKPGSAACAVFSALTNLQYLALVGTPETAELGLSDTLLDRIAPATGRHLHQSRVRRWEYGNAESVSDTEEAVSEALRWMRHAGLDPSEIVVDVSAGRRAMGYGAKDAADAALVETQYLAAQWDTVTNRPKAGTSMFKVIKAFHH